MSAIRRKVELVVISDVHLGTYGSHAKELKKLLKSIEPEILVLNGDIIDIWQFSKRYWPKAHMKVIKEILNFSLNGTKIYYITGNHDELLRKFADTKFGNLEIVNKLVLDLDGKKSWFFHGDVFDVTMQHAKWLAKLGAKGYDALILINRAANYLLKLVGKERISLSKRIKNGVKSAVNFINNFEQLTTELAAQNNFDYVVCGHIHQPDIKLFTTKHGQVTYLNSGDWVENLSWLEYDKKTWSLKMFEDDWWDNDIEDDDDSDLDGKQIFNDLLIEFKLSNLN
jgi:UDP-2,3-diacylglucosamine pyrophosphatase LpxH